jgi:hypothetical protein
MLRGQFISLLPKLATIPFALDTPGGILECYETGRPITVSVRP